MILWFTPHDQVNYCNPNKLTTLIISQIIYMSNKDAIRGKNTPISRNDRILILASIATIFISGIYFETNIGILYLSYPLMAACYLFIATKRRSLGLDRKIVRLIILIIASTIISGIYLFIKSSISPDYITITGSRIILLTFFLAYYTSIYSLCKKSIQILFSHYLDVALFFALVGVAQQIIFYFFKIDILQQISNGSKNYGEFLGVAAFSVEPAFYACALVPAGAYHLSNSLNTFKINKSGLIILAAIIFSTSSLGYIGLFFSIILNYFGNHSWKKIGTIILATPVILAAAYNISNLDFFQTRLNDSISVLRGGELTMSEGMNLSSYSNAVNTSIAMKSIKENYGLGVGFGAYSLAFDRYINNYEFPAYRDTIPGRGSATSMFARLTAELGIVSWILFIMITYWIIYNYKNKNTTSINIALASTFLIILIRMGEYYANGVILVFLSIYLLNRETKQEINNVHNGIYYKN